MRNRKARKGAVLEITIVVVGLVSSYLTLLAERETNNALSKALEIRQIDAEKCKPCDKIEFEKQY